MIAGIDSTRRTRVDSRLKRMVEEELACEPSVDACSIGIATRAGIVTLSGHVGSYAEKLSAEQAAARVNGVRAVVTELDVKLPGLARVSDEEIAGAAVSALSWNTAVPSERIRIRVEDGWVTLEGDVDWGYQKAAAYSTVACLKGVRGVRDRLVIKPVSASAAVKAHLEAALVRRFGARSRHITVETRGDHATLRGTVASLAERDAAERAAWTTPGVCHVDNNLSVGTPGSRPRTRR